VEPGTRPAPREDELVRAQLHLPGQAVSELARRLPSHGNRDDLSSAAMLGLAQAARSWDPGRGPASSATPPPGSAAPCPSGCPRW
jgi:RNA polymerase sigma factor for flagellar operon FliA